jgi:plastocyanin
LKRFLGFILIIAIASSVFGLGITSAVAADPNVTIRVALDKREVAQGGSVQATVIVKNNYADPITNVQVIYDNNGSSVFSGVTINPGTEYGTQKSYTISFPSGSNAVAMSFTLTFLDPTGTAQTNTTATQVNQSTVIKVTGSAKASDSSVTAGDRVEFTFTFKNEGNVKIENASLKAPPIDGGGTIGQSFTLNPGDTKEMTYTSKVNSTIEVKPTLTFTAAGANKTLNLDSLTVTVEQSVQSGISLSLKADKDTVNAGEDTVLTATINNTGGSTLTDIALLDENRQPVQTNVTALASGKSGTATVTVTPQATQNYTFSVSAKDPDGKEVTSTSNQVTVTVAEAEPTSSEESNATLAIVVDADAYSLKAPGEITFHVTITNNSDVLLNNVQVTEETIGEIGTISAMGKDSKTFDKTVQVDKTTDFVFKVTATQEDGTPVTAVTDPLTVTIEGNTGVGLGFLGVLLIIIVIAIVAVGVTLFLMNRKNKRSGTSGVFGGNTGGKGPYNGRRKPSSFNNTIVKPNGRDTAPQKTMRKPVSAPKPPSSKGKTKFEDRNKF